MKRNQKILFIIWIVAMATAFVAIFVGFANGLNITAKSGKEWLEFGYESVYKIMFVDRSWVFKNWGVLILSFVCLLLALGAIVTVFVLNLRKKTYKKLNLGLTISAIALLIISALIMFCICPIVCEDFLYSRYYVVKLGYGSVGWGSFCCISALALGASIFVNKKLLNGQY